jgi:hypothetical protein
LTAESGEAWSPPTTSTTRHIPTDRRTPDGLIIVDAPNEVAITSILLAAMAPGHLRATKTTVLLTPDQVVEAMRKAGGAGYRGPASGGAG